MTRLSVIHPDEATPRTSYTARPQYVVQVADLRPYPAPCIRCGGPTIRLTIDVPPGQGGGHDQGPPKLDLLGGLTKYLRPHECERCELATALHRLFPPPYLPPVESPEAIEIRRLRAELAGPAPAREAPVIPGALFDLGMVEATRTALKLLVRCYEPPSPAVGVQGYESVAGPKHLTPFLALHAAGDFGAVGRLGEGDADRGRADGPLSSRLDRNSSAIADGRGTVRSSYTLFDEAHRAMLARYGSAPSAGQLHLWTEIGSPSVTLVHLADDVG